MCEPFLTSTLQGLSYNGNLIAIITGIQQLSQYVHTCTRAYIQLLQFIQYINCIWFSSNNYCKYILTIGQISSVQSAVYVNQSRCVNVYNVIHRSLMCKHCKQTGTHVYVTSCHNNQSTSLHAHMIQQFSQQSKLIPFVDD